MSLLEDFQVCSTLSKPSRCVLHLSEETIACLTHMKHGVQFPTLNKLSMESCVHNLSSWKVERYEDQRFEAIIGHLRPGQTTQNSVKKRKLEDRMNRVHGTLHGCCCSCSENICRSCLLTSGSRGALKV